MTPDHPDDAVLVRLIRDDDDACVASIIRDVMTEHGAAGPGFAIHDAEVAAMTAAYAREGAAYFVVETLEDGVLGGGGIAPLLAQDGTPIAGTCELRKMYFRPQLRGRGVGHRLLVHCLRAAAALGYERCYLETLGSMKAARALYGRSGFAKLDGPIGDTRHFSCDAYYARALDGLDIDTPALHTERLTLRTPRVADHPAMMRWLSDREVMRYIGDGQPRPPAGGAHFIAAPLRCFEARGYGFFTVTLGAEEAARRGLETGAPIGDAGLVPIPSSGRHGLRGPDIELGYRYAREHWGHGYATEVAQALVAHARTVVKRETLIAVTDPLNAASQRVLTKAGMRAVGVTRRYYDVALVTFELSLR
jgi:putative acetyltransferase